MRSSYAALTGIETADGAAENEMIYLAPGAAAVLRVGVGPDDDNLPSDLKCRTNLAVL